MRPTLLIAVAVLAMGCSSTRTVKVGWDVPAVAPDGYRIFIDEWVVMEIPPPPVDRTCDCLMVSLPVPRGRHLIRVLAYNRNGASTAASITVQ
jgi:hypothetical protein